MITTNDSSISDDCYGINYSIGRMRNDPFFKRNRRDSKYTVPASILTELMTDENGPLRQLERQRISEGFDESLLPLKRVGNALLHAWGTMHIAAECLEFNRLRYRSQDNLDHGLTLAQRLNYGKGEADSLREEFCLAAFFQPCIPHLRRILGQDGRSETDADEEMRVVTSLIESTRAYQDYVAEEGGTAKIRPDIIAYWMSGKGEAPEFKVQADHINLGAGALEPHKHIIRVRQLYFAPDAPLNLMHIDLCARVFTAHRWSLEKPGDKDAPFNFSPSLSKFLDRIYIGPDVHRVSRHLLPQAHWNPRNPYYVPSSEDFPTYVYLEPFVEAMRLTKKARRVSSNPNGHSFFNIFTKRADEYEPKTGFFRLSLLQHAPVYDRALAFHQALIDTISEA